MKVLFLPFFSSGWSDAPFFLGEKGAPSTPRQKQLCKMYDLEKLQINEVSTVLRPPTSLLLPSLAAKWDWEAFIF